MDWKSTKLIYGFVNPIYLNTHSTLKCIDKNSYNHKLNFIRTRFSVKNSVITCSKVDSTSSKSDSVENSSASKSIEIVTPRSISLNSDETQEQVILVTPEDNSVISNSNIKKSFVDSTPAKIGIGFISAILLTQIWSRFLGPFLSRLIIQRLTKSLFSKSNLNSKTAANGSASSTSHSFSTPTNGQRVKATPQRHRTTEDANDLIENKAKRFILVGGKGGVGKTSISAAVATHFADEGVTTLIVSTDPAHSLSDVFEQKLDSGRPIPVLGIENLFAQEISPDQVKNNYDFLGSSDANDLLGMGDLNGLFETLPPGFDEAAALVEIVKYIVGDPEYSKFERIVFDTAPTGHTLRLLSLPDFMDSFLGKIGSMKNRMNDMMGQMKGMFGVDLDTSSDSDDLEEMKRSMRLVRDLFRDETHTEFVVATIPNMMAVSESSRLIDELRESGIPVHHVVLNQIQQENNDCAFCSARHKEQQANLKYVRQQFSDLAISPIQFFDREIRGPYALRVMGAQIFPKKQELSPQNTNHSSQSDIQSNTFHTHSSTSNSQQTSTQSQQQ